MLPVQHYASTSITAVGQQQQRRYLLQAEFLPPVLRNPGTSEILDEARQMNDSVANVLYGLSSRIATSSSTSRNNAYLPSTSQSGTMSTSPIISQLQANILSLLSMPGSNHLDIISSLQQLNQNNKPRPKQEQARSTSFLNFQAQQQQQSFAATTRAQTSSTDSRTEQDVMVRRKAIIDDVLRKAGIATKSTTIVMSDSLSSSSGSNSGDSASSTSAQQQRDSLTSVAQGVWAGTNKKVLVKLGSTALERRMHKVPYFDASTLQDPDAATVAMRKSRSGVSEAFPDKLYRMLTDAPKEGHQGIISFHPHGRSFNIHHPDRFVKEVLPKYFRQSRLSSFHRQLNLYGFARINTGCDAGGYYHELFLRGRPALGAHIQRAGTLKSVHRKRGAKAYDLSAEPDFYRLPAIRLTAS